MHTPQTHTHTQNDVRVVLINANSEEYAECPASVVLKSVEFSEQAASTHKHASVHNERYTYIGSLTNGTLVVLTYMHVPLVSSAAIRKEKTTQRDYIVPQRAREAYIER